MENIESLFIKPVVLFHSVDADGVFSAWVCDSFYHMSKTASKYHTKLDFIPWNYGEIINSVDYKKLRDASVIIMSDATLPDDYMTEFAHKIVWLDHHLFAIEHSKSQEWKKHLLYDGAVDGTAGCLLTWYFFYNTIASEIEKELDFSLPYFVKYAACYDVWDKEDPNADYFSCYVRKYFTFGTSSLKRSSFEALKSNFALINSDITSHKHHVLHEGYLIYKQREEENERQCKSLAWYTTFLGYNVAIANYTRCNSEWFKYIVNKHPDIEYLIGFSYSFASKSWKISCYNSSTNPNGNALDILQEISDKYGDKVVSFGGHRAACGMIITDISPILDRLIDKKA